MLGRGGRALQGPAQVADQATGLCGWEVLGFLVAQQCPCQPQQPAVPAWKCLTLLASGQESQGREGRSHAGTARGWVGVLKIHPLTRHPSTLQKSLENANVELCLHV